MVKSYDDNYYICTTCDKALRKNSVPYQAVVNRLNVALRKNSVPCQAVANRLNAAELPKLFQDILRLERLFISRRILFTKVTIMPKGKSRQVKGSIWNIPVSEVDVNCNMLPRPTDSNGLLIVKSKSKLEYKVTATGLEPTTT